MLRDTLFDLTSLPGPPGAEQPVVEYLMEELQPTAARVEVDPIGNLYARVGEPGATPHLMISAHSDEVAALVRHVDEEGFLRLDPLGGIVPAHLIAQRVVVAGNPGVVGTRPGHLQTNEEQLQVPSFGDLFVDVGARSQTEVAELGIEVGTPITYHSPLMAFANGDRVNGKAIDNRLGCAILLELFRDLSGRDVKGCMTGLFAVQEEVGMRGSTVGAYRTDPDYAVVVDTFPIGDTPGVAEGRLPGSHGSGPVLVSAAFSQRLAKGHLAHPRVTELLISAAEEAQVAVQRGTSIGWAVTDAAAIHLSREGIPTGVIGLPRRYSHSPICMFDLNDGIAAVRLLKEFISTMDEHTDLSFLGESSDG